ncbi:MAG TPA: OB-fold nucleic acid binding domain-containing protein, partial [Vicinamibacterales bacterium]|nr:OB-fold nucleic acid binding domain-containing protein [Vicinamibacterales bacterium]
TLVKDAQRRGVRFHPIDVQVSGWDCTVEPDGAIRLGLRYVRGLREQAGRAMAQPAPARPARPAPSASVCPKCGCDDPSMIERVETHGAGARWFCNTCSHDWEGADRSIDPAARTLQPGAQTARFRSLDDLVARTGLRRDEIVTLADIGALNRFGYDRRSALWQAERAVRPSGELFEEDRDTRSDPRPDAAGEPEARHLETLDAEWPEIPDCPLRPMTEAERVVADYAGMGLTAGRHPMALRRDELAMQGVLRAIDLPRGRHGRRVRVAGMVITRQRPGTAKGFVFLTLEDETGVANIIVRPDLFARERLTIVEEPFLLVDGVLQTQEGVISVRAEQVHAMRGGAEVDFDAHDFY